MKYVFEWDEEKNEANFEKHGIWFDDELFGLILTGKRHLIQITVKTKIDI